jgi:hypothetical protein
MMPAIIPRARGQRQKRAILAINLLSGCVALLLASQIGVARAQLYIGNWSMAGSFADHDGTGEYALSLHQPKDVLNIRCDAGKYSLEIFTAPTSGHIDIGIYLDGKPSFLLAGKPQEPLLVGLGSNPGPREGDTVDAPLSSDQLAVLSRAEKSITLVYQNRSVQFPDLRGHKKAFQLFGTACAN